MSLFGKKKTFNYNTDFLPGKDKKFEHLNYIMRKPGEINARIVLQKGGASIVPLPYPVFNESVSPNRALGEIEPDRNNDDTEGRDYGQWLFSCEGVLKFGKTQVTLLFDNPEGLMKLDHPVHAINHAVSQVIMNKNSPPVVTPFGTSESDNWITLAKGDGAKVYGCLPRPENLLMCYSAIYSLGEEDFGTAPLGTAPEDPPYVFVMSRSTAFQFLDALDERADVTGSAVCHFYDRKAGVCRARTNAERSKEKAAAFGGRRTAPSQGPAAEKTAGYDVYVSDTIDGLPGSFNPSQHRDKFAAIAASKVRPWHEVLKGHTPDECAAVVGKVCGLPLSLLYHAWANHPEWYPQQIQERIRNPKSIVSTATAPANRPTRTSPFDPPATQPVTDDVDQDVPTTAEGFDDDATDNRGPDYGDDDGVDQNAYEEANRKLREAALRNKRQ